MNTLETRIADYKSSVMNEFLGRKIEISGFTYPYIQRLYLEKIAAYNDLDAIIDMKNDLDIKKSIVAVFKDLLKPELLLDLDSMAHTLITSEKNKFEFKNISELEFFIILCEFVSKNNELTSFYERNSGAVLYRVLYNFFEGILKSNDAKLINHLDKDNLTKILNLYPILFNKGKEEHIKSFKVNFIMYSINETLLSTKTSLLDIENFDLDNVNYDLYNEIESKIEEEKELKKQTDLENTFSFKVKSFFKKVA